MAAKSQAYVRVFLVPTTSYITYSQQCNINTLAALLNDSQKIFQFIVMGGKTARGLPIIKETQLKYINFNPSHRKPPDVEREAVNSYIVDLDAFTQIKRFLEKNVSNGFRDDDLAIAISSDVYVPDIPDNAFDSEAASDSYSCLGSGVTINDIDNNKEKQFNNIAIISLARVGLIFPEAWDKDRDVHARRAIISRYIVTNIAHFLAGRIFSQDLDRDHQALCVAEANWIGGEKASYQAKGLCELCKDCVKEVGVANKFKEIGNWSRFIRGIDDVTGVAERIDKLVEERGRYKYFIELAAVVAAAGLVANLLAGYSRDITIWDYSLSHYPAVSLAILGALVAAVLRIRIWYRNKRIP